MHHRRMRLHNAPTLRSLWLVGLLAIAAGSGCDNNPFGGGGMFDDGDPRKEARKLLAAAIDAPKPAQSFESRWGSEVECFNTFGSFKSAARDAGRKAPDGYEWHHIVNQHDENKKRFGKRLHCTDNLIALPKDIHIVVSNHYQSKEKWTDGKRVREALAPRAWHEQYDYGLKVLRKHGITP